MHAGDDEGRARWGTTKEVLIMFNFLENVIKVLLLSIFVALSPQELPDDRRPPQTEFSIAESTNAFN